MQDIQYKANNGQFNIDEAQGIVECFVAGIGNKDSVGDIVVSGAFSKSLIRRKPRVVWGHNWNDPIGKVLEIYEVPPNDPRLPQKMKMAGIGGLYAKVQFNLNSEKGREAFTNVAFFGEEQEWSIGYKTLDAIFDNGKQANILREVELYELSPVLHGANQLTGTISVKSDDEKMHMTHMMPGAAVAVTEKPQAPVDPFAQGVAQPANSDRTAALERELSTRTGGPIKVMKANESSVIFLKPGKGLFRLGYYFDGEQYMFGKPEKLGATMIVQPGMPNAQPKPQRIPNFPNVQGKPSIQQPIIPVKYGDDLASGFFDSNDKTFEDEIKDLSNILSGTSNAPQGDAVVSKLTDIVNSLQEIIGNHQEKSELLIPCPVQHIFETKSALDPVFDYHRIETYVTEDGIVIASPMSADAYEAVEAATKGLIGRIGRGIGGGGKVRRGRAALARIEGVLDPRKRRDVDGDGMIFDGTWREMPDPTRFAQQALRSARSESDGPTEKPKPKRQTNAGERVRRGTAWYQDLPPDKKPLPLFLTQKEKGKLTRMFDTYFAGPGKDLPEDHILRRVGKEISTSKQAQVAMGFATAEGTRARGIQSKIWLPNINKYDLEELRAIWPEVKDDFATAGAPPANRGAGGERGRSAFEIINSFVEKGEYQRKNKGTGGGGGEANRDKNRERIARGSVATGARTRQFATNNPLIEAELTQKLDADGDPEFDDNNQPIMTPTGNARVFGALTRTSNDKIVFNPNSRWIKNGILPSEWMTMTPVEREEWWYENREDVKKTAILEPGQATASIRKEMKDNYDAVENVIMDDVERYEKQEATKKRRLEQREVARRDAAAGKDKTPTPASKPTPKPAAASTPKTTTNKYENFQSKLSSLMQKKLDEGSVRESFVNDVDDLMARVIEAIFREGGDDTITREGLLDATEVVDKELLNVLRNNPKPKDSENKIIGLLQNLRSSLEDDAQTIRPSAASSGRRRRGRDTEGDLDIESDAVENLGGRSRDADRMGARAEGDEDEFGDAVDRGFESGTDRYDEDGFGEDTEAQSYRGARSASSRAVQNALTFQRAYARRQQSRGARSTSGTIKPPRTMVTAESTWWKKIGDSLRTEIDKADTEEIRKGLTLLRDLITKYEAGAFKPNSQRTNVGSIKVTAKEADLILDAVMAVVDRQQTAGRSNTVGSRSEIFAELLEKVSRAAMSTFVDKTSSPIDDDSAGPKRRR